MTLLQLNDKMAHKKDDISEYIFRHSNRQVHGKSNRYCTENNIYNTSQCPYTIHNIL